MNISTSIVKVLINEQEVANLSCAFICIETDKEYTTVTLHQVDKPMAVFSYNKEQTSITHETKDYYEEYTLNINVA